MKLFIMVVILVMLTSTVLAGGIDLSTLTLDELVNLRNNINTEIYIRGEGEDSEIFTGTYIVGVDILQGTYAVKCLTPELSSNMINVIVYDKDDDQVSWVDIHLGREGFVSLKDGQTLKLCYGGGTIREVHPSWAP